MAGARGEIGMIEVIKKGKPTRIAFTCPICTCEFVADEEDYIRNAYPMPVKKKTVYIVTYACRCPNCKYKVEKKEQIEEVKRE